MKKNKKTGFTMLEILVALTLVVIVVGLSAFLYAKSARLRKLITYQNDIQNALNSMITEINFGSRDAIGFQYAYDIGRNVENPFYQLVFYDRTKGETVFYLVSPGMDSGQPSLLPTTDTDTTLWQAKGNFSGIPARNSGEWKLIDVNKTIILVSETGFTYYKATSAGLNEIDDLSVDTPVAVKIKLSGKTTDPSLKTRPVTTVTTMIRPKNKLPF